MNKRQVESHRENLNRLPEELDAVADKMFQVGCMMEYYGGFGEMAEHGKELQGAAAIAKSWAKVMRKDRK